MEPMVRFIQTAESEPRNPYIVSGLPDVGLVGTIASAFLAESLGFEEMGYVESSLFPPIIVLHGGDVNYPTRLYRSEDSAILLLLSEIPVALKAIKPLCEATMSWASAKKPRYMLSLSGIAAPNRLEIEEPKTYGVATTPELKELLQKTGVMSLDEGFIVGVYAEMLKASLSANLPHILLLAECYPNYPDPGAAASILNTFSQLTQVKVDTAALKEQADEIKVKARELMRRTQSTLRQVPKSQEVEMPLLYR